MEDFIKKNIIDRQENEHFLKYLDRLLNLKEKKIVDIEKTEIYELVFGKAISANESRKRIYCWEDIKKRGKEEGLEIDDIIEVVDSMVKSDVKEIQNKVDSNAYKTISDEEDRVQVIDMGDKYHLYNSKRSIVIPKDKVKLIKELYCDDNGLTINELCRKIDIPRRDFMLVKNGFNITHDDVPFLDEDIEDENLDDLVSKTLESRKEKYFIKLQQEEIRVMKAELENYRRQDYIVDKIISGINEIVITPVKYNVNIIKTLKVREGLLDVMDTHLGLKMNNFWNKYSIEEARRRFDLLTKETIERCAETGVRILHVSGMGDYVAGLIHESIKTESEIDVVKQTKLATELMGKMLLEFSIVFEKVVFSDITGNHGRLIPNKNSCTDGENIELFINWGLRLMLQNTKNIEFEDNLYDDGIIAKRIAGVLIFEVHGDNDKLAKVAQDLTMMIEKPSEIHMGHTHHNQANEVHCVEVFVGRSFSGVDTYAKNLRATSKAGQKLYIYEDGKRLYIADIELN